MSLNPIVALTEKLEKLITERGSATIQTKHIALLKDQFAILEKENARLNTKLEKFISKNQVLRTENVNLKKENAGLKQNIKAYENPVHNKPPDEIKIKILRCLSKQKQYISTESIARSTRLSHQIALFNLEELSVRHMVTRIIGLMSVPTTWTLTHEGRRYLLDNNLLK